MVSIFVLDNELNRKKWIFFITENDFYSFGDSEAFFNKNECATSSVKEGTNDIIRFSDLKKIYDIIQ